MGHRLLVADPLSAHCTPHLQAAAAASDSDVD